MFTILQLFCLVTRYLYKFAYFFFNCNHFSNLIYRTMVRHKGIKKPKKRRNQPYSKKARTTNLDIIRKNVTDSSADITTRTSPARNNTAVVSTANCGSPLTGMRSAGLCEDFIHNANNNSPKDDIGVDHPRTYESPGDCTVLAASDRQKFDDVFHEDSEKITITNDISSPRSEDSSCYISNRTDNLCSKGQPPNHPRNLKHELINRVSKSLPNCNSCTISRAHTNTYSEIFSSNSDFTNNTTSCHDMYLGNEIHIQESASTTPISNDSHNNNSIRLDDSSTSNNTVPELLNNHYLDTNILNSSYSTRRRHVRNLKQYILSIGSLDLQASIMVDLVKGRKELLQLKTPLKLFTTGMKGGM